MTTSADNVEKVAARWRCGHPRSAANTKLVRNRTGKTCLKCFRTHNAKYIRDKRAALNLARGDQ